MMRIPLIIRPPADDGESMAPAKTDFYTVNVDLFPSIADFSTEESSCPILR